MTDRGRKAVELFMGERDPVDGAPDDPTEDNGGVTNAVLPPPPLLEQAQEPVGDAIGRVIARLGKQGQPPGPDTEEVLPEEPPKEPHGWEGSGWGSYEPPPPGPSILSRIGDVAVSTFKWSISEESNPLKLVAGLGHLGADIIEDFAKEVADIGIAELGPYFALTEDAAERARARNVRRGEEAWAFAQTPLGAITYGAMPLTGGIGPRATRIVMQRELSVKATKALQAKTATQLLRIPKTDDVFSLAFGEGKFPAAPIPGIKQLVGVIKPAAIANNPIKQATIIRSIIEDMSEAGVLIATAKARVMETSGRLGFYTRVFKTKAGEVVDPAVKQIKALPGRGRSMALHDIVEYGSRYKMNRPQRRLVDEIRRTSKLLSSYARNEGVALKQLKGESDWRYLHRVVLTHKQDAVQWMAPEMERTTGIVRGFGESPWAYLQRVTRSAAEGNVVLNSESKQLINQLADVIDVTIRRQNPQAARKYATVADAMEAGARFAESPVEELISQARWVYQEIGNKRTGEFLKQLTLSRDEYVAFLGKSDLFNVVRATRDTLAQAMRLQRAVGARQPSSRTLTSLSETFPVVVTELRRTLGIRRDEVARVIKELSTEMQRIEVTPKGFATVLNDVRIGAPPSSAVSAAELSRTLAALGLNQSKSAKMLEKIYQNAATERLAPRSKKYAEQFGKREQPQRTLAEVRKVIRNLSDEMRALGTTQKRFNDELANVRSGKPRGSAVSDTELQKTLKALGAEERQAATIIGRVQRAVATERAGIESEAFAKLQGVAKGIVADARSKKNTAERALARARGEVTEGVRGAELGQVIGVPGISGRIFPTQAINGKQVLGRDIAQEVRKTFGYMPKTWAGRATSEAAMVGDMYRLFKASMDMGIQTLQLMGALGLDTANLLMAPVGLAQKAMRVPVTFRPTAIFPKAAVRSYWAFFNPKHELNYWLKPDKMAALRERTAYGSLTQPSEFTAGQGILRQVVERVPKFGERLGQAVGQTFGRADAAWSTGRNIAGNEMWIAFREMAAAQNSLPQLAKMTNLATGVLSMRGMGRSRTATELLRAFAFFSPRYTLAQYALVRHIFSGGYTGAMARRTIMGMAATNTLIFTLIPMALGQKPAINPLPKKFGGNGSDLWTIEGPDGSRMGIGGLLYSPTRLIMEAAAAAVDEPDKLLVFDQDNPIVRSFRGKAAGFTSLSWDYLSGRDFIGEPVRDTESFKPTKDTLKWAARSVTFIWAESLISEGWRGLPAAVAEWFGFRTRPESAWEAYRMMVEKATGQEFDDISKTQRRELELTNQDVALKLEEFKSQADKRGWNPEESAFFQEIADVRLRRWAIILVGEAQMLSGARSYGEQKDLIQRTGLIASGEYAQVKRNPLYASFIKRLENKDDIKWQDRLKAFLGVKPREFEEDIAYEDFVSIFNNRALYDITGMPDYEKRDTFFDAWEQRYSPTAIQATKERRALEVLQAPRTLQEWYAFQELTRQYWEKKARYLKGHPATQEIEDRINSELQSPNPDPLTIQRLERSVLYRRMDDHLKRVRKIMRLRDPSLTAMLWQWGYPVTVTPAARRRLLEDGFSALLVAQEQATEQSQLEVEAKQSDEAALEAREEEDLRLLGLVAKDDNDGK